MKIFISGASRGLGLCLANEFVKRQNTVWGIGRSPLEKENPNFPAERFIYTQCDTCVYEETKNIFNEMLNLRFTPDIAVFCAGSATEDIIGNNFKVKEFRVNFELNLFGVLNWVEFLLPVFIKRNKGIFAGISSMSTYRENHRKRIGYSVSKLSLNKAFENMRMEYLNTGIRFGIFNMGRMGEEKGFIGTSYPEAACSIASVLESGNIPKVTNMPFLQWLLTKMTVYIPNRMYYKYFYK
jgi:NADP-dependent 3-hydroxy acid dehydrogenase YdfG